MAVIEFLSVDNTVTTVSLILACINSFKITLKIHALGICKSTAGKDKFSFFLSKTNGEVVLFLPFLE